MTDRRALAKSLLASRLMRSPAEVKDFEGARIGLFETHDPRVIPDLLAALDDATEHEEVAWGVVHDAESFGSQAYVDALVRATPRMVKRGPDWAVLLHGRVLNNAALSDFYVQRVRTLPRDARVIISGVIAKVGTSNRRIGKRTEEIRKRIA